MSLDLEDVMHAINANSAQLVEIRGQFKADLDIVTTKLNALTTEVGGLKKSVETLSDDLARVKRDTTENIARLQRTVNSIESFPRPPGYPKSFESATEYHSVTDPVRRELGYMG